MSENLSAMQKHAEKIIASLILAALLFVGTTLYNMSSTLAVMVSRMDSMEQKLSATSARFEQYQTKEQARSEWKTQALRDQILTDRIQELKDELDNR